MQIARDAHKDQKEKIRGRPYIIHPLCVAIILADLELDKGIHHRRDPP